MLRYAAALLPFLAAQVQATASTTIEFPPGSATDVADFRAKHPYDPGPLPTDRPVVRIRASKDDADDVSCAFYAGLHKANNGGTLYLPEGETFVIGKALDLPFLDDIEIRLDGTILFTPDIPYWQAHGFQYPFQNATSFWRWGGQNVRLYGNGTIDGSGQVWWEDIGDQANEEYLRPILFYGENLTHFSMEGVHLQNSPIWHQLYVTSADISMTDMICTALSTNSSAFPKNTDFFDSLMVDGINVKNAWVSIGDDCFSPKTNSTNIHVDTMYCNGTHGQSMGSIGQYAGQMSIIENVLVENVYIMNGANGPRMKSWAGPDIGYGYINNVTYRNFYMVNNDRTAELDSCYFNIKADQCASYPSQVNITNITLENINSVVNGKYGRATAKFTCSTNPNAVCENIRLVNWNVTSQCDGPPIVICDGIKDGLGDVPCYNSTSPEAIAASKDTC